MTTDPQFSPSPAAGEGVVGEGVDGGAVARGAGHGRECIVSERWREMDAGHARGWASLLSSRCRLHLIMPCGIVVGCFPEASRVQKRECTRRVAGLDERGRAEEWKRQQQRGLCEDAEMAV